MCIGSGNEGSVPIDVTIPPGFSEDSIELRTDAPHAFVLDEACSEVRGSLRGVADTGLEKEWGFQRELSRVVPGSFPRAENDGLEALIGNADIAVVGWDDPGDMDG